MTEQEQFAERFHDKIVELVGGIISGDKPLMLPSDAARELIRAAANVCISGGLSHAEAAQYIQHAATIIASDAPMTSSKH